MAPKKTTGKPTKKGAEKGKVQPRLSPEQEDYIDQLIVIGNFGTSRTTVATNLISMAIRQLINEQYITPKKRQS